MHALKATFVLLLTLLGAACPFHYTDKLRHDIVEPAVLMKLQSAEAMKFYDTQKPLITRKGNTVELLISATKNVNNSSLLDASLISIKVNACSQKAVSTDWVSPFVENAPKH